MPGVADDLSGLTDQLLAATVRQELLKCMIRIREAMIEKPSMQAVEPAWLDGMAEAAGIISQHMSEMEGA